MPGNGLQHVVVLGAGMAGLAAAEALLGAADRPKVTVVEAAGRVGGVLATACHDGWLVERSADNFLAARPEAVALAERLGLGDELIGVDAAVRRALVWHAGRAVPVPTGFRLLAPGRITGILSTRLLSPAGRIRVLLERFVPPRSASGSAAEDDESLESFVVRRLGREAFERLVQPLAAGIWTADPARLSMAAACPEFLAMEREHGSLWAGERHRVRRGADGTTAGARYGQFLTLASGMETLPRRLAERLRAGGVNFLTANATSLERAPAGGWQIGLASSRAGVRQAVAADAVVIAVPAPAASRMLSSFDRELAAELAAISYAGSAIVSLGFERGDVPHPLDAAGMVVPRVAGRGIIAASFSSSKFPGRAPAGHVLIRVFAGGALDPEAMQLDDAALEARAREEIGALLGVRGRPLLMQIDRWPDAMPQYHVGHLDRVRRIEQGAASHPALALAGAAYRGVGIPQVIASGQAAAQRILDALLAMRS